MCIMHADNDMHHVYDVMDIVIISVIHIKIRNLCKNVIDLCMEKLFTNNILVIEMAKT